MAAASLLRHPNGSRGVRTTAAGSVGSPKAITAIAHKLAKLVYRMIKHGEAYVTKRAEEYEAQYQERRLQALQRNSSRSWIPPSSL